MLIGINSRRGFSAAA